jgi:transcriptional regulator of acetoin/glycerol metabolism
VSDAARSLTPAYTRTVRVAHEAFLIAAPNSHADETHTIGDLPIRPLVRESWRRSLASGVDPDRALVPAAFDAAELRGYRDSHPLSTVMPVVRRLLTEAAVDANHMVAVGDAQGRLLWVEGDPALVARAEAINFIEGSWWSEDRAGTNAPGLALALDRPVQVFAAEHFSRLVQPWSCTAVPVHDPDTLQLLGFLDLTGGDHVASPQAMALVRAAVAAMESELRLQRLQQPPVLRPRRRAPRHGDRLTVLGLDHAILTLGSQDFRLSPRHSEMILLLLMHSIGLSADELAVELLEGEINTVTVRAEMSRLRRLVGADAVQSQPYRLTSDLSCDLLRVKELLRRGSVRQAIAAYSGPVLPRSLAPGIVAIREDIRTELREQAWASGEAELVLEAAELPDFRDDVQLWETALQLLPAGDPKRGHVQAHLRVLDRELGL